jgi:RHS repeat-associated protein
MALCAVVALASFCIAVLSGQAPARAQEPAAAVEGQIGAQLVVQGMGWLVGDQQLRAQERSERLDPEAIAARAASRTAYASLSGGAVAGLYRHLAPALLASAPSGLPRLAPGERVTGYLGTRAARIQTAQGKRVVIASTLPIAAPTQAGGRRAIDLTLASAAGGYEPVASPAPAHLPASLSAGVTLSDSGLTLTPVLPSGAPLRGSGQAAGGSVLYANTQRAADTLVKPTSTGFETYTLLRSAQSPQRLAYRLTLPGGGLRLRRPKGSQSLQVLSGGQLVATIPLPAAQDAEGTQVPVSVSIAGNILELSVPHRGGDYRYPIAVDPTIEDSKLRFEWEGGDWGFEYSSAAFGYLHGTESAGTLVDTGSGSLNETMWGQFHYATQGESHIYKMVVESGMTVASGKVASAFKFMHNIEEKAVVETYPGEPLSKVEREFETAYSRTRTELCPTHTCETGGGSAENTVVYHQQVNSASSGFTATLYAATMFISQSGSPTSAFNTESTTIKGQPNVLHGTTNWLGPNTGVFEVKGSDPGVGLSEWSRSTPFEGGWLITEKPYCEGVQCLPKIGLDIGYNEMNEVEKPGRWVETHHLPDGEDTVEFKVKDAMNLTATASATVKVDATAPHGIALTGLPGNLEIGDNVYHLKAQATDGNGSKLSSGIASLSLAVDGVPFGSPAGSCAESNQCTATAEWTVSGSEFAVGQHEVTVSATDKAGNVGTEKFTMYVARPTSPLPVGPGTIEPQSGELTLSATDISMPAPAGALTLSRTYGSLHVGPASDVEGPLGPEWQMSFGGGQYLSKLPNGDMLLTDGKGLQAVYASEGSGKFKAPTGDQGLTLSEQTVEGKTQFTLTDGSGAKTIFTQVSGGSSTVWMQSTREEPATHGSTTISYQYKAGITEPTQVTAPAPAGVSCSPELKRGCRALTFNYATSTTATGETPSGWGDYIGRLTRVYFTAWDPEAAKMTTTTVAQYSYDSQGRLRAEWDPRISPALKTTYGYDWSERVVAVTPPGQQPWLLNYGSIQNDTRIGRLLSVTRPSASTEFGNGNKPANTAAPSISGTATVGSVLTATSGTWSNGALAYTYQWENCNSSGGECKFITGAVNPTYTVLPSSVGHALYVQVTAINAAGAAAVPSSSGTAVVAAPKYYFYQFGSEGSGNGQFKGPAGVAVDATGKYIWVADSGDNRIEKFEAPGKFLAAYGTEGTGSVQFKKPTGIAIDSSTGNLYVTDSGNNRVEILDSTGKYVGEFGSEGSTVGKFKNPTGIAITPSNNRIYVVDSGNNRVQLFELSTSKYAGMFSKAGFRTFSGPNGISASPLAEQQMVADTGNDEVDINTPLCEATGSCTKFGDSLDYPFGIAENWATGSVYVSYTLANKIQKFNLEGTYQETFGGPGSGSFGQFKTPKWMAPVIEGPYAEGIYIADTGNNRIVLASPKVQVPDPPMSAPTPPSYGTSAVTTIEYKVPVSGAGAPYALGSAEAATWGETAAPVEGTAIFPPDEPEGWPAQDYKRASITYLDYRGREVNSASPGGAISTTEYNEYNEVARTLSPANREAALKEGSKSAEVSKLLDTQTVYNTGSEAGLEITETLGPQHKVKLSSGSEVEARAHTIYHYDEGAPSEGGPYRLATKVTVGAQFSGKEEDVRTTVTGYGGQEGLGWKLRQPTSVTVDPGGLNLVQRTIYDPNTGNAIEKRAPGGSGEGAPPVSASQFGSLGSSVGQFNHPEGAAIDAKGNVWVVDGNNNRVQKFNATGGEGVAYGSEGTGNGQFKHPGGIAVNLANGNVYVADTNNNRVQELNSKGEYVRQWGALGTGNGQFKSPAGLAIDSSGNVYVADAANNRVQEFSAEGAYVAQFGAVGTGNGQFKSPGGLAFAYGNLYVVDWGNSRVQEFNSKLEFVRAFGSAGTGQGQFKEPWGIAGDPASGDLYVADNANNRMQEFDPNGKFLNEFGSFGTGEGHFWGPDGVAIDTTGNVYVADEFNARIDIWTQQSARDTQTIYYTAGTNGTVAACGEHPEWEGLVCETRPARQPETGGVPNLPVTTVTYNLLGESVSTVNTVGTTVRTSSMTYDAAGRPLTRSVTSTVGTALPMVKDEYNSETGGLVKQSTTSEGKTRTLTNVFNSLGELVSYTDADENTATYTYDIDGRQEKVNDGKGTQTFTYDTTTGLVGQLVDSAAGTFTGTYDIEGRLTTEGYPNGMNVKSTFNAIGEQTSLEYLKTTHCTEKCTWYSDSVSPSIAGRWLSQSSTLSSQAYSYDAMGRLTQVQDTPAGKGCTTRIYAYDVETNRTSLTTRNPMESGACATSGGTVESHTYDVANRLLDTGISYDTFGNVLKLPAADAGGSELTSTYYVDNTLATQSQGGQTIGYNLDPAGRVRETVSTGLKNSTVTSHFAGNGEAPAWTVDTGGNVTRSIMGIGGFAATQYNAEAPILQIENLHGDVVATASISETGTGLTSTNDASEYGVPRTSSPPKFSWLGGDQKSTELASGVVAMGVRSYVPQLGRFLQTDPVPGGSANSYSYVQGDPVNESDPSGEFVPKWFEGAGDTVSKEMLEAEAARQAAAAVAAAAAAAAAIAPSGDGGEDPIALVGWRNALKVADWIKSLIDKLDHWDKPNSVLGILNGFIDIPEAIDKALGLVDAIAIRSRNEWEWAEQWMRRCSSWAKGAKGMCWMKFDATKIPGTSRYWIHGFEAHTCSLAWGDKYSHTWDCGAHAGGFIMTIPPGGR